MKKGIYHLFIDETDDKNMIVYIRDEENIPIMIFNFYSDEKYAHIHMLFEAEDPENPEEIHKGSMIKKIELKGDFDFNTLKSNIGTNWTTTDEYDILSVRESDTLSQLLTDEEFYRRSNLLDEIIKNKG